MPLLLLALACGPGPAEPPLPGELLISQLYTSGASPAGGADHYFSDQFIELVNAADHPLDLAGVRIADVFGAAGEINAGMRPDSFAESHPDQVVMSTVWAIPAGARLEPGEHLLIAQDGTNHRPFSTVDLSGAAFEAFVADSERDDDHPTSANLESVVYNAGYDWLMTVFGPSVVVLDASAPLTEVDGPFGPLPAAPVEGVLDAVETLMDAESAAFKRLPPAVDAGFAWVAGPYTGEALHRVRAGEGWQDSADSGADFVVGPPAPARPEATGAIYGEPRLELGTGTQAWAPLAEGAEIPLIAGPQGGWHLDVGACVAGMDPSGVQLVYEALTEDAERISFVTQATLDARSVLSAEDGFYRVGDRVVLDIAAADEVLAQAVILRVTAALEGQTWSDERRVVVAAR